MATNFPDNGIQTFKNFLDITASDGIMISEYQRYMQQGNLTEANRVLEQIPDYDRKIITAEDLNTIVDTNTALQQYFVGKYSPAYIVSTAQPALQQANDFWFKIL